MAVEIPKEKWSGKIGELVIGATAAEGGTRSKKVVVGGSETLPYLYFEGAHPNPIALAMEVLDVIPEDYPEAVKNALGDAINSPSTWAKKCVDEYGVDLINLKLIGTNPEEQDRSPDEAAKTVREVLDAVSVPLIIYGSGNEEKDAKVMEAVSNEAKGERCLLGLAEEAAFKSLAVAAMANNHAIVAFSNLDINLAKQMNILLTDFGVKLEDIIMDPLVAGLGYGLEYSYSVMERIRLAAFMGDKILQVPMIADASVAWKARESSIDNPDWGDASKRGPTWESMTAIGAIMAGADVLIFRHPESLKIVRKTLEELNKAKEFTGGGA
ncbi:CO dehydrogenase/acetyl-CoA synthase subunit delta [[Eubacterium] cellulosolvens]